MIIKLITHAAVFAVGAGAGIYWSTLHPSQAANLAETEQAKIQQAVALAKQNVLQQVVQDQNAAGANGATAAGGNSVNLSNKYQQMLQNAQQELNTAKSKLSGQ